MQTAAQQQRKQNRIRRLKLVFWVLIGIVVILLVGSIIFNLLTPQPVVREAVVQTEDQFSAEISIADISLTIPERIALYQATAQVITIDQVAAQIVSTYQLEEDERMPNIWQSANGSLYLQLDQDSQSIRFLNQDNIPLQSGVATVYTATELQAQVEQFIQSLRMYNNYVWQDPQPILFSTYNIAPTTPELANGYLFKANFQLDGVPVVFDSQSQAAIEVYIRNDGEIVKADLSAQEYVFSRQGEVKSLTPEEIVTQIQSSKIIYLSVENTDVVAEAPQNLTEISLIPERIEYRVNGVNGFTLPYLRFVGTGMNQQEMVEIVAATPLVPTQ